MRKLALACAVAAALIPGRGGTRLSAAQDIDSAFAIFWNARTPQDAESAASAVKQSGAPFEEIWSRLERGRTYASSVPRGVVALQREGGGLSFPYTVEVPESYDPAKRYQVRVQLHGGVGRDKAGPRGNAGIGALAGAEQIYVMPTAWRGAPWWSPRQEDNLNAILDAVRRTYNVDENRVALAGVSDGATATFYFGMRDTTPFASFLALNGHILVLGGPGMGIGDLFPNNLLNKPIFTVNGALDPLYPAASVMPYLEHLRNRGVQIESNVQPTGAHNTRWWPWVKDSFEAFVAAHPRNPYPDRITWETDRTDLHNRAAWLVIDALRPPSAGEPQFSDVNELPKPLVMNFGVIGDRPRVSMVQPGSGAHRLGLRPGDVIASINSRAISRSTELLDILNALEAGAPLAITVVRGGREVELQAMFQGDFLPGIPMFWHESRSGRVDLVRAGNLIEARTRGVGAFTLLLSPDMFDFSAPLKVVVNGRTAFEGRVERSVATLLKWAAHDNDRTMLFGAELRVAPQG